MEKIEIIYSSSVEFYLKDLVKILFDQEYFGFEETAQQYVQNIYDAIELKLAQPIYKISPPELQKQGKFYIAYSPNKRTTWYIFFNQRANRYLIKFITNNHVPNAQFL